MGWKIYSFPQSFQWRHILKKENKTDSNRSFWIVQPFNFTMIWLLDLTVSSISSACRILGSPPHNSTRILLSRIIGSTGVINWSNDGIIGRIRPCYDHINVTLWVQRTLNKTFICCQKLCQKPLPEHSTRLFQQMDIAGERVRIFLVKRNTHNLLPGISTLFHLACAFF